MPRDLKFNPKNFTDAQLQLQLSASRRRLNDAISNRQKRSSGYLSDAAALQLDEEVAEAEEEVRAVTFEINKRNKDPKRKPDGTPLPDMTVTAKKNAPIIPKAIYNPWEDEPEQPTISVWDNGILRPWRPGDPMK